ncbi:MAG TPA: DUF5990 family protein [Pyrinomonadaceae bacterium]|nr:DUF5990 family protein [Pyrinomonadaceae bacterium]
MPKTETYLPLRIIVVDPPIGVLFAVQRGKAELETQSLSNGEPLSFEFSVRIGDRADEMPNFLGPYVQGPRGGRFVYVNSGTLAGQVASRWTRRAKVGLKDIGWDLVDCVLSQPSKRLEAKIAGQAGDGGPACATVRLLADGWAIDK